MTSILSQEKQVFNATNSNAIISKSKNIFSVFFCICWIDLEIGLLLKKKDEPRRLFVYEIIDCKKWG